MPALVPHQHSTCASLGGFVPACFPATPFWPATADAARCFQTGAGGGKAGTFRPAPVGAKRSPHAPAGGKPSAREIVPQQAAMVAVDMLPLLEQQAKERQTAALKRGTEVPVREKVPERDTGKATEHAAAGGKLLFDWRPSLARPPSPPPPRWEAPRQLPCGVSSRPVFRASVCGRYHPKPATRLGTFTPYPLEPVHGRSRYAPSPSALGGGGIPPPPETCTDGDVSPRPVRAAKAAAACSVALGARPLPWGTFSPGSGALPGPSDWRPPTPRQKLPRPPAPLPS